jgi:hypothetical protein
LDQTGATVMQVQQVCCILVYDEVGYAKTVDKTWCKNVPCLNMHNTVCHRQQEVQLVFSKNITHLYTKTSNKTCKQCMQCDPIYHQRPCSNKKEIGDSAKTSSISKVPGVIAVTTSHQFCPISVE